MKDIVISDAVKYIGADDKDLDLFESQYIVPRRSILQLLCDPGREDRSYGYD